MDNFQDEEKATSYASMKFTKEKLDKKILNKVFRQQKILTIIQCIITFFVFIIGLVLSIYFDCFIKLGNININDISIQNLELNIGTILILSSIYMAIKITLNLNININQE